MNGRRMAGWIVIGLGITSVFGSLLTLISMFNPIATGGLLFAAIMLIEAGRVIGDF